MKGFALGAVAQATGAHPAVQGWYASFLKTFIIPQPAFWAYLITFGELAVGLGLIVGCLTGFAAFFGLVMNFNYVLAGAVSTNPILGFLALFLLLAWRIAGYYGVDRYLLPRLGTPWTGSLQNEEQRSPPPATPSNAEFNGNGSLPPFRQAETSGSKSSDADRRAQDREASPDGIISQGSK
jgi:thiosulfate dehydrogenase (quinone) large subunit